MVNIQDIREAASELSPSALKLYLYFVENLDSYFFHLSPKDFMTAYNVSESTYRRAKTELLEKGYLAQEENQLHFYANKDDLPLSKEQYRKRINELGKNLLMEGAKREEVEKIIAPAKALNGKTKNEKIKIYNHIILDLKDELKHYVENHDFL